MPSFGPLNIEANATSSTTIVVKWGDVPKEHQNGLIEGYKVYYAAESKSPVQYKLIASNSTFTTTLTELRKFVVYRIQVLAYTRLGDGEPSKPAVSVRTFEDGAFTWSNKLSYVSFIILVPGPPSNVSFPDVSVTSARIIWDVPEEPNGEILAYKVTYHINNANVNNKFSKEFPPSDRTFRYDFEKVESCAVMIIGSLQVHTIGVRKVLYVFRDRSDSTGLGKNGSRFGLYNE